MPQILSSGTHWLLAWIYQMGNHLSWRHLVMETPGNMERLLAFSPGDSSYFPLLLAWTVENTPQSSHWFDAVWHPSDVTVLAECINKLDVICFVFFAKISDVNFLSDESNIFWKYFTTIFHEHVNLVAEKFTVTLMLCLNIYLHDIYWYKVALFFICLITLYTRFP